MRPILAWGVLTAVLGSACAPSAGRAPRPGPRDLVTADEIASVQVHTAYEALERLRPQLLRTRGTTSMRNPSADPPRVYVDGVHFGGLETLRSILAVDVLEIRRISAADATIRFGTGHTGGALLVRTRRGT